jgi:cysteinyl-tRNA synthetase
MGLRFTNTLTRRKEEFESIEEGHVRMYTCGPTVYDHAHVGNFRAYVFEDLLRRYLSFKGYDVTQVMNLTDIDDKTIKGCQEESISLDDYTARYKQAFFEDVDSLRIRHAEYYPEATKHIDEMVSMVKTLLDKGYAYEMGGSIYFKIAKFSEYGRLSHMDMSQLKSGVRVAADEYEKEQASDFALWKGWDETDGPVFWKTDLGKGRPGWHIECSAMSTKYLGNHFDIHCGGVDNIFPHHENEIAQSKAATGDKFVNYWMHNEYLIVEGRKMSKSLGNYYTLRQVLEKGYPAVAVRYLLMATHYRQQLNFTFDGLEGAKGAIERLWDFMDNVSAVKGGEPNPAVDEHIERALGKFEESLDDDLNISPALAAVFDFVRDINRLIHEGTLSSADGARVLDTMNRFDSVLGLMEREKTDLDSEIEVLIAERIDARKNKDFATADKIRDDLLDRGILLEDTPAGTKWKRKL